MKHMPKVQLENVNNICPKSLEIKDMVKKKTLKTILMSYFAGRIKSSTICKIQK